MHLTEFCNYAVRTLIYAGLKEHHPSGVPEIARAYGISQNHLNKVASELCHLGYLEKTRGRTGGVGLIMPPEKISIGGVIRKTESTPSFVECLDKPTNTCQFSSSCKFLIALEKALENFFTDLDRNTLAEIIEDRDTLSRSLGFEVSMAPSSADTFNIIPASVCG